MARCELCGCKVEKKQKCKNCGEALGEFSATIKTGDGSTAKTVVCISEKFIVVKQVPGMLGLILDVVMFQVFGALVGLIINLFSDAVFKNKNGFINIKDVYGIIVAPQEKGYCSIKIILVDGSEIVCNDVLERGVEDMKKTFASVGVNVVHGTAQDVVYAKPYAYDIKDIKFGVSPEAASFLKLNSKNKIMPKIENCVQVDQ